MKSSLYKRELTIFTINFEQPQNLQSSLNLNLIDFPLASLEIQTSPNVSIIFTFTSLIRFECAKESEILRLAKQNRNEIKKKTWAFCLFVEKVVNWSVCAIVDNRFVRVKLQYGLQYITNYNCLVKIALKQLFSCVNANNAH